MDSQRSTLSGKLRHVSKPFFESLQQQKFPNLKTVQQLGPWYLISCHSFSLLKITQNSSKKPAPQLRWGNFENPVEQEIWRTDSNSLKHGSDSDISDSVIGVIGIKSPWSQHHVRGGPWQLAQPGVICVSIFTLIVTAWRFDTRQQNSATRSCSGPYFLSIHCTYLYGDRNYIFGTSCIKRTLNFLCHFSHFFCDAVGGQRANMAFLSRCKMAVSTFSNIPGDHRMTRKINSRWQWIDWACFDGQSDTWSIACLSSLHIDLTGYSQSFLFCLHKAL